MSDKQDYDACYNAFMAIPDVEVKAPEISVESAVQENENLYFWSLDDKAELMAAGLPETTIDALPERNGACRVAESLWKRERYTPHDAQKEWAERSPAAYQLRDQLLHTFRYAFRNNKQLLGRVNAISDGYGDADMIQDLSDLTALGEKNPEPLQLINFDFTLFGTASTSADELAIVLARANGEKEIDNEVKITRDRAYTYMKQAADEIKNCGRYVFWKNEARLKGYRNIYRNKTYKKNKSDNNTELGE
ncbi:hypothetical protein OU798_18955 [Prolixibacteraceae bacterium Z1-6]|uniref:Uncharacterized protein n=1 Tax=Draconibacterium aestuarii TaxID=2998507 RepID=A0A9X3F8C0_9BACT|nr:hypothetical protein [Prolixibacteraceae bacterium Z1-6]